MSERCACRVCERTSQRANVWVLWSCGVMCILCNGDIMTNMRLREDYHLKICFNCYIKLMWYVYERVFNWSLSHRSHTHKHTNIYRFIINDNNNINKRLFQWRMMVRCSCYLVEMIFIEELGQSFSPDASLLIWFHLFYHKLNNRIISISAIFGDAMHPICI